MKHIVMQAPDYNRIDGRNACQSNSKRMTLGEPLRVENKSMKIAAQLWSQTEDGALEVCAELPVHQVLDLMIFLGRTMQYFREAYRMPLLYDPQNPLVERIGLQGDAMQLEVCTENSQIDEDIQAFANALGELGELTGERLRCLARILKDMEY